MTITIGYTERYLGWTGSAASPQRARLAVEHISARAEDQQIEVEFLNPDVALFDMENVQDALTLVHDASYVKRVFKGKDGHANTREQGQIATLMFLGTKVLVEQIEADGFAPKVYFNPQGAKHHAAKAASSGFCVFNDHAWAAQYFAAQGLRVAYLDWDVHHGDGVEALCKDNPLIMTASIQGRGFPGTGYRTSMKHRALNYMLDDFDGDAELLESVEDALYAFRDFDPQIILLACGADGLKGDPLGRLNYTIEGGITPAAHLVGQLAFELGVPVLIGGAGGYQPFTYTPIAWAETVLAIHEELAGGPRISMAWDRGTVATDEPEWASALDRDWDNSRPQDPELDDDESDLVGGDPTAMDDAWDRESISARKRAIMARLEGTDPLTWENVLTREEFTLVVDEVTPLVLEAMEAAVGAKPSRTKEARNATRRQAKGKGRRG